MFGRIGFLNMARPNASGPGPTPTGGGQVSPLSILNSEPTMPAHEFASLFPMLSDLDLQTLADDIATNGLQTPITTLDGKILDGRNRYRACEIAGVDPTMEEYIGGDPLGFVISHNLHRRHLTEPQRAMVASKLANLGLGDNQHKEGIGIPIPSAAQMLNVSKDSVSQARKIAKNGVPELSEAVMQGGVSLAAAADVATLPAEEQTSVVSKGKDAIREAAKTIREAAKEALPLPPAAPEPDSEPEPVIVDGVGTQTRRSPIKVVESEGMRIWMLAKTHLDRISKHDEFREEALKACEKYCAERLASKK